MPFSCMCGAVLSSSTHLKQHIDRVHGVGRREFVCGYCEKAFFTQPELVLHVRSHTGEKPYVCEVCDRSFTAKSNLRRHARIHSWLRPYECRHRACSKRFGCSSIRNAHEKTHRRDDDPETYAKSLEACDICQKRFTCLGSVTSHRRAVHATQKMYACPLCNYRCAWPAVLHEHITRRHTGERPHPCLRPNCHKRFTTASELKRHVESQHTTDKLHTCSDDTCDRRFASRQLLKSHVTNCHSNARHPCDVCGRVFKTAKLLRSHTRVHRNPSADDAARPFPCQFCDNHKRFKTASALRAHIATHTNERPFPCGQCGKMFKTKASLVRHQHFHEAKDKDERPIRKHETATIKNSRCQVKCNINSNRKIKECVVKVVRLSEHKQLTY